MSRGLYCPKADKPCTCGDVIDVLSSKKKRHPCALPGPGNGLNVFGKPWMTEPDKPTK